MEGGRSGRCVGSGVGGGGGGWLRAETVELNWSSTVCAVRKRREVGRGRGGGGGVEEGRRRDWKAKRVNVKLRMIVSTQTEFALRSKAHTEYLVR